MITGETPPRILVCDDEGGVIEAYRRVFADLTVAESTEADDDYDMLSIELFGGGAPTGKGDAVADIVYCRQGEEAVAVFAQAKRQGRPFAAVFLDMRMPPGIDGIETAKRMRMVDAAINIVIVTGNCDYRPSKIATMIGAPDRLFYLVKPFDGDELCQLATTLVNRWASDELIASELAARVKELERVSLALRRNEISAQQAACRDPITGLLNRHGLEQQFTVAAARSSEEGLGLAFLHLQLDRFELANDTREHGSDDRLICEIANRIEAGIGPNGLLARLGSDEFAVVCTDGIQLDAALAWIMRTADMPSTDTEPHLPVSFSVGYSLCSPCRDQLSEVMRQAHIALYTAKAAGGGVVRAFDPDVDQELMRNRALVRDLKDTIRSGALLLHYQPLMSADGERVTGLEALLRWDHPVHGSISPAIFVPLAEQSTLMMELGDWVLRQAMSDVRLWPDLVTSINLSAVQFARPDFAEKLIELARAQGVRPCMIEFEITETSLSRDMDNLIEQVEKLCQAGFSFALDDFGSIGYLNQLRFKKLKIDSSFIRDLNLKPNADRMIHSIIGLGEAMGLTVTAEGVEQEFQHQFLKSAGCSQLQGFLFHKPYCREAIQLLLSRQRSTRDAA